jgi:hypothetical protein
MKQDFKSNSISPVIYSKLEFIYKSSFRYDRVESCLPSAGSNGKQGPLSLDLCSAPQ